MRKNNYWVCLFFLTVVQSILTGSCYAQNGTNHFIWNLDNLSDIGGYPVTVFGKPVVKEFQFGKAMEFDGINDGLIVNGCPINKDSSFTVELIFKPYDAFPNNIEQRFFHMQNPLLPDRRLMIELRIINQNEWFADSHIHADDKFVTCLAKEFPHLVNRWYHIAVVYKNGISTHYVNGVRELSGRVPYIPVDNAYVALGMRMNKIWFFKGAIQSVGFSPDALPPSEFILSSRIADIQKNELNTKIIVSDDFNNDSVDWIAEFEKPSSSAMTFGNGMLDVNSEAGATVWYKHKLSGNIMITYDAMILDSGGKNDRISDLNAFWMASDPGKENVFGRKGKFSSYDNLSLYYAGVGGHDNETTRFRKYFPNGEKPVIKEYLDKGHLLKGNKKYSVKIIIKNGRTLYYLNNVLYFDYTDEKPLTEGYFGFRTTRSHQQFCKFKIYSLGSERK